MSTDTAQAESTREKLVSVAADEMRRFGFRAASLERILSQAGVTKGALYYHFSNKQELGYAVLDEVYRPEVMEAWAAVVSSTSPLDTIRELLGTIYERMQGNTLACGCAINNLAQEMSPVDEGFRERIDAVFTAWREMLTEALERGQREGSVRGNIDCEKAALFIISVVEGAVSQAKASHSREVLKASVEGLAHYLEALRPRACFRGAD